MLLLKQLLLFGVAALVSEGRTTIKPMTGSLYLQVKEIEKKKGCIRIALYQAETDFLKDGHSCLGKMIPIEAEGPLEIELPNLKYGQYAVAIYHDTNDNNKLDKNLLGIPKEPYGFSNNPKVKWRAPKFQEASFLLDQTQKKLFIDLKRWKNW